MSVRLGHTVTRFIPAQTLEYAAKAFADEGVTDLALVRRDDYDETCRLAQIGRAFESTLRAASLTGEQEMSADAEYTHMKARKDAILSRCRFCGKDKPKTLEGIAPERTRICTDCITVCVEAMNDWLCGRTSPLCNEADAMTEIPEIHHDE